MASPVDIKIDLTQAPSEALESLSSDVTALRELVLELSLQIDALRDEMKPLSEDEEVQLMEAIRRSEAANLSSSP